MDPRGEKEVQVLAALARAFLSAPDSQAFGRRALSSLFSVFDLDLGALYLLQGSEFSLFVEAGPSARFVARAGRTPRVHPLLEKALQERRPLVCSDGLGPEPGDEGVAAVLLPLFLGEQAFGVLALGTRRPWKPGEEELAVLQRSAQFLVRALAQALERAETAELFTRYRYMVENDLFGVFVLQDGRFVFANEGMAKIGGYPKEELLGRAYLEVIHPEDRERARQNLEAHPRGEPAGRRPRLRFLGKDGTAKVVEVQAWPVLFSGRPAVQGLARDVTWEAETERLRESLLRAAREILKGKDLATLLRHVAQAVVVHSPFRRAVVSLYDLHHVPPLLGPTTVVATAGLTPEEEAVLRAQGGLPPRARALAFQEAFRIGRSYYIPHDRVPWEPTLGLPGKRASEGWHPDDLLLIPLRGTAGIVGHISVDEPVTPKAPTLEMLAPLELFADLAALAAERVFQLEELRRHKEWLRGAFRLAHELARFETVEELLPGALEILRRELRYEFGAVLLAEGDSWVVAAAHSDLPGPRFQRGQRIPKGRGIVGWVGDKGRPLRVEDVSQDPRYVPVHPAIRSELAVPLRFRHELRGVLDVESVEIGRFRPEDEEFLAAVGDLLATAIEGLRAREALWDLSQRDPLTNVYNRRSLFEVLGREAQRAQRYGRPLSVALLDVDHFREVNNRFGHAQGDEVLKGVANVLLQNLRSCDYVFRYGGDEFLLLFPETDAAGAEEAVERVRERLKAWSRALALDLVLDVSFGIATHTPESPKTPEELLREADARLYERRRLRLG